MIPRTDLVIAAAPLNRRVPALRFGPGSKRTARLVDQYRLAHAAGTPCRLKMHAVWVQTLPPSDAAIGAIDGLAGDVGHAAVAARDIQLGRLPFAEVSPKEGENQSRKGEQSHGQARLLSMPITRNYGERSVNLPRGASDFGTICVRFY